MADLPVSSAGQQNGDSATPHSPALSLWIWLPSSLRTQDGMRRILGKPPTRHPFQDPTRFSDMLCKEPTGFWEELRGI